MAHRTKWTFFAVDVMCRLDLYLPNLFLKRTDESPRRGNIAKTNGRNYLFNFFIFLNFIVFNRDPKIGVEKRRRALDRTD